MDLMAIVILHYMSAELTNQCIMSIKSTLSYSNYKIIVIDNGSYNKSGRILAEQYKNDDDIKVIVLNENLGFSKGNNIGYKYAREVLHADYIIIINNDTKMIQKDFLEKILENYNNNKYYVLGPDVINLDGMHQSPLRDHIITKNEAYKWLLKRSLFSYYLRIHKMLNLSEKSIIYRKYMTKKNQHKMQSNSRILENIELQGACFIFSPIYIEKNDYAFEELTFMYGEESLLSIRCRKNGWKVLYSPNIKILHLEEQSTKQTQKNNLEMEIFRTHNYVKAIKKIIRSLL